MCKSVQRTVHLILLVYSGERSRIHELKILLRFLGKILEVSVYNFYIANQFQTTFAKGGRSKSVSLGDSEKQGGKLLRLLSQLLPRIRPQLGLFTSEPVPRERCTVHSEQVLFVNKLQLLM